MVPSGSPNENTCPDFLPQDFNPETETCDPPFERWMRLADDLLKKRPYEEASQRSR